jgi:hypothetical protein
MTSAPYQSSAERAELDPRIKQLQQQEFDRIVSASGDLVRTQQWSVDEAIKRAARDAYNLDYQAIKR